MAEGTRVKVQFSLKSNDANLSTADQVAERFHSLFNFFEPGDRSSNTQIAPRFQNVKTTNRETEKDGDR